MHSVPKRFEPQFGLHTSGTPARVLVIEGSDYAGELLRAREEESGIEVVSARDPRHALKQLQNEFYDAVVVELPHPAMSAGELFRSVISFDLEQALRIVFIASDLSDPETRRFLTQAGRPFLTRPVDLEELHELVLRVASAARPYDREDDELD